MTRILWLMAWQSARTGNISGESGLFLSKTHTSPLHRAEPRRRSVSKRSVIPWSIINAQKRLREEHLLDLFWQPRELQPHPQATNCIATLCVGPVDTAVVHIDESRCSLGGRNFTGGHTTSRCQRMRDVEPGRSMLTYELMHQVLWTPLTRCCSRPGSAQAQPRLPRQTWPRDQLAISGPVAGPLRLAHMA
jgi:hypothetical protein